MVKSARGSAAEELTHEGTPISLVRSIFVPEDETCFSLCEAASVEAVRELAKRAELQDSSTPGDVVVQKFVLSPGGQSGRHLHPGPAIVTVKSGQFTLDQEDCSSATDSAGQVVAEPTGHVHRVRNLGTTDLEFWVAFLDIPVGSPQRLEPETLDPDWVQPAC